MTDFEIKKGHESFKRFLRPGDVATVTFVPQVGTIDVSAGGLDAGGGITVTGKPGRGLPGESGPGGLHGGGRGPGGVPGGTTHIPSVPRHSAGHLVIHQDARVEVSLIPPGQRSPATSKVFHIGDIALSEQHTHPPAHLRLGVHPVQAGRTWRCRFKNVGDNRIRAFGSIDYVAKRREIHRTVVPLRLLNHAFRQVVDLIAPEVHFQGEKGTVRVSDDLERLTGGDIPTVHLPSQIHDLSIYAFGMSAHLDRGRPAFEFFLNFDRISAEFFHSVASLDVRKLDIRVLIALAGTHTLLPEATVHVDAQAWAEVLVFGGDASRALADAVRSAIQKLVDEPVYRKQVGGYLADAFVELAQRGHRFYDLIGDPDGFVVRHVAPHAHSEPVQPPHLEFPSADGIEPAPLPEGPLSNLKKIQNIVVLMQENRSFDHMLGYLSHPRFGKRGDIAGLSGDERNPPPETGKAIHSHPLENPNFPYSPEHGFHEVATQIANGDMSGFVSSFVGRWPLVPPDMVMGFFTDEVLPVYDFLARTYSICDHWFSAYPGDTQPNRFCTLSGHTPVLENFDIDDPVVAYLKLPTIFDLLSEAGVTWKYFENDVAFLRVYDRYRLDDEHVIPFSDSRDGFLVSAREGRLPQVTFIDPNFVDVPPVRTATDDHAPASVVGGQHAIAQIHDALVKSPQWVTPSKDAGILFVITYDEHGGFYDHVPPPGTDKSREKGPIAPVHPNGNPFLGVRVPMFAISPFVAAGGANHNVFDNTALLKTIGLRFLGGADFKHFPPFRLGPRVAQSRHLGELLTETRPRHVGTFAEKGHKIPKAERRTRSEEPLRTDCFQEIMRNFARPTRAR